MRNKKILPIALVLTIAALCGCTHKGEMEIAKREKFALQYDKIARDTSLSFEERDYQLDCLVDRESDYARVINNHRLSEAERQFQLEMRKLTDDYKKTQEVSKIEKAVTLTKKILD